MVESNFFENLRDGGLEYYGKYYSLYAGIVTSNSDPQGQGRIKVRVPALGRDEDVSNFAYPVSPFAGEGFGFFFPPEVGQTVWVMFEGGDANMPLYVGGWWGNASKGPTSSGVPAEANPKGGSPVIRELRTKAGHRIVFDDTSGAGGITIQTPKGTVIKLDDSDGSVKVISSSTVSVQALEAKVEAQAVNVTAQAVSIAGQSVRINNGTKFAAAIGDGTQGGPTAQTIVGPPTGMRPLIP